MLCPHPYQVGKLIAMRIDTCRRKDKEKAAPGEKGEKVASATSKRARSPDVDYQKQMQQLMQQHWQQQMAAAYPLFQSMAAANPLFQSMAAGQSRWPMQTPPQYERHREFMRAQSGASQAMKRPRLEAASMLGAEEEDVIEGSDGE